MKKTTVAFDIECYYNYFYILFKSQNNKTFFVRMHNDEITGDVETLRAIIKRHTLVSFNGENYDMWVLAAFLQGYSNKQLKLLSDTIINDNLKPWEFNQRFPSLIRPSCDHIDLAGPTPLQASLKAYGCRLHSPKLQDLPIEPSAIITEKDAELLELYCENDVDVTLLIYNTMQSDIDLRIEMGREYNTDFRSLSGPQIAERVLKAELIKQGITPARRKGPIKPFKYNAPDYIKFNNDAFKSALEAAVGSDFTVSPSGKVDLPEKLKKVIEFEGAKYKIGVGGLHSQEKAQAIVPKENEILGEFDVASMYPSLISNLGMYPKHVGPEFLNVYQNIIDTRLKAKNEGDKLVSNSLKLVLNSSYGKFGSKYSWLYSPELLVQTTITGQLCLLMLIEKMHEHGFKVVSANTDGVNVLMPKTQFYIAENISREFTKQTGLILEFTEYLATYSESVNSYIAFKPDGYKTKGIYEGGSIGKGYANQVCVDAVIAYLSKGTPIGLTIANQTDVRKFLTMRGVKGGGMWRGNELGKVVRWYQATDGEPITYKTNGNKVAGSDGAWPMMDLQNDIPYNLDYKWYERHAEKMLVKLGVK